MRIRKVARPVAPGVKRLRRRQERYEVRAGVGIWLLCFALGWLGAIAWVRV